MPTLLTIDRGHDVLPWDATGISPTGHITGPTCGMHWANLIHPDPARNLEVVKEWVDFLAPYDEKLDTMLAVDSEAFQSQLIYHRCVKIKQEENGVWFDFSALDNFPGDKVKNEFNLKVSGKEKLVFASNSMEIQQEPKQHSKSNTLHVLKLKRKPKITKAFMTISGG